MTTYIYMESAIGRLLLAGDEDGLARVMFPGGKRAQEPERDWIPGAPRHFHDATQQLTAYFAGKLRHFDLPLKMQGTPFQIAVWNALREIPYGETISYGELARRVSKPKASRAVGSANGANPIPIIVPCHRVIASTGKLGGFGGGLPTKEILLNLERGSGALRAAKAP